MGDSNADADTVLQGDTASSINTTRTPPRKKQKRMQKYMHYFRIILFIIKVNCWIIICFPCVYVTHKYASNSIQGPIVKKSVHSQKKGVRKFSTPGRVKAISSAGPANEVSLIYFSGSWQP